MYGHKAHILLNGLAIMEFCSDTHSITFWWETKKMEMLLPL